MLMMGMIIKKQRERLTQTSSFLEA